MVEELDPLRSGSSYAMSSAQTTQTDSAGCACVCVNLLTCKIHSCGNKEKEAVSLARVRGIFTRRGLGRCWREEEDGGCDIL